MKKLKIGFISLFETDTKDSFVGTLLVTDNYGIPLEFKCTHAVKATAIQKALYGERLQPYIGIELCGVPLIKSINNYPDIVFINLPYMMAIRSQVEYPVFLINSAVEEIRKRKEEEEITETDNKIFLEHEYETFEPIVIQSHPDYKKEIGKYTDEIKSIFSNFDLSEPFDRMQKSVEILGKSDSKFK